MSWTRSLLAVLLLSVPAAAETVPPLILPELAESAVASPPPLRLAESQAVQAGAMLRRAAEGALDRMDAMTLRNLSGALPVQNGFARPLPSPMRMRLAAAASSTGSAGSRVWGSRVRVAGAWRLRLHLEKVSLPAGTRLWVWGPGRSRGRSGWSCSGRRATSGPPAWAARTCSWRSRCQLVVLERRPAWRSARWASFSAPAP